MAAEAMEAEVVTVAVEAAEAALLLPTLLLLVAADGKGILAQHSFRRLFHSHDLIPHRFEGIIIFKGVSGTWFRRTLHGSGEMLGPIIDRRSWM